MKTLCGFCALLMLIILCNDVMTEASTKQIVFHLLLLFGNVIGTNIDD